MTNAGTEYLAQLERCRESFLVLQKTGELSERADMALRVQELDEEIARLKSPTPKRRSPVVTRDGLNMHTASLMKAIAPVIKSYVQQAVIPLEARVRALEEKLAKPR